MRNYKLTQMQLLTPLLLWSCMALSQTEEDTCTGPIVRDITYTVVVNPSLKPIHIHLMQGERCYTLIVFRDHESKPLQIIRHEAESDEPLPVEDGEDKENLISFVDVNFDHFKDLMVLENESIHDSYIFYLFDTLSGTFVYNEAFSDTVGYQPTINEDDQSIMTRGGTSEDDWWANTYEVHDGTLVLAESEEATRYEINGELQKDRNGETICVHTLKRLVNGRMKLIKKVISPSSQVDEAWNKK